MTSGIALSSEPAKAPRLDWLDLLRGIIMVVMSLDHIRDYFTNFPVAPEDVVHTWPALFFTRWITHFCAPLFFFLAGTGAYLFASRGRSPAPSRRSSPPDSPEELRHFLWTRGLWLVALELTVLGFGWSFQPWTFAGVIWSLGWCMVLMSVIVRMPVRWIAIFGVGMIFTHNLLDGFQVKGPQGFGWLWMLLHQNGFIPVLPKLGIFFVLYTIIPWLGVMAAGYSFGAIVRFDAAARRQWMTLIGAASIVLFVVLRATNFYGQPSDPKLAFASLAKFQVQATPVMTLIGFLDVQKYPPALQYLLMTLGPGLLALAMFDRWQMAGTWLGRVFVVFGRVPLFYYVLHIYAIHIAAVLIGMACGQPVRWLFHGAFMNNQAPPGYGQGLDVVYAVLIGINVMLYFPCRWYAEYKRTHQAWWLSYV